MKPLSVGSRVRLAGEKYRELGLGPEHVGTLESFDGADRAVVKLPNGVRFGAPLKDLVHA